MKELLQIRDLRTAVVARAVSQVGDVMTLTALSLLIATTGRPLDLTILLVAFAVPVVVFAGYAGRLVDRADSRRLLVGAGLLQVVGSLGLLGPTVLAWQVCCILLVQVGQAVTAPTWGALIPRIVGEERVGQAVGLQQSMASLAWMAGPAVGGLLYGVVGFRCVIAVDTATFALIVLAALTVGTRRSAGLAGGEASLTPGAADPRREVATADHAEPAPGAESGLRLVLSDRVLLCLVVALGLFVLALEGVNVVESFLVVDVLHAGPSAFGFLGLVMGVGIALGSMLAARVVVTRTRVQVLAGSAALMGATIGAAGLAPTYEILPCLYLLAGVGNGLVNALNIAIVIGRTPDRARGRVLATVMGLSRACSVLALVLGGLAGQLIGPRATFVVGGILATCVAPLVLSAVRQLGTQPRSTSEQGAERAPQDAPPAA